MDRALYSCTAYPLDTLVYLRCLRRKNTESPAPQNTHTESAGKALAPALICMLAQPMDMARFIPVHDAGKRSRGEIEEWQHVRDGSKVPHEWNGAEHATLVPCSSIVVKRARRIHRSSLYMHASAVGGPGCVNGAVVHPPPPPPPSSIGWGVTQKEKTRRRRRRKPAAGGKPCTPFVSKRRLATSLEEVRHPFGTCVGEDGWMCYLILINFDQSPI